MKKYLFLLSFFCAALNGIPQTPTFNKKIFFCDSLDYEYASQVVEVSDGYLIAGTSVPWQGTYYNSNESKLVILKLDFNGNLIKKVIYGDTSVAFTCPYRNVIQKMEEGNLLLILNSTSGSFLDRTIMMKINEEGDSLWTKDIYKAGVFDGEMVVNAVATTPDHGYVIGGDFGFTSIVVHTDSSGNVLWSKLLGENSVHSSMSLYSIATTPDNGCVAGYYVYNAQGFTGAGVVVKLDSAGEFKWWHEFGNGQFYGGTGEVLVSKMEDSTLLVFSDYFVGYPLTFKQTDVAKLHPDGSLVWIKSLETWNTQISMYGCAELKDSTWVICGYQGTGKGWIYNVTSEGDSLFYREYNLRSGKNVSSAQNPYLQKLFGITSTTDDGLLMAGDFCINGLGHEDPWILKTDRFGCLQPGCEPYAIYVTTQPQPVTVCPEDSALFTSGATGDSISFHWQILNGSTWQNITDDSVYSGTQTDSLHIKNAQHMMGNYLFRCRVNNSKFTVFSHEVALSVREPVSILLNPSNNYVKLHSSAVFSVSVSGTPPVFYQWYWNDKIVPDAKDSILIIENVIEVDTSGPYYCKISNACNEVNSTNAVITINTEGIWNQDETIRFTIFPNPADEYLTIRCNAQPEFPLIIRFFDLTGQVIKQITSEKQETFLNVMNIPQGCYFLEIQEGLKKTHRKIILH